MEDKNYRSNLIKKALGFFAVFGPERITDSFRNFLESASDEGLCSQEDIQGAEEKYKRNYAPSIEKLLKLH